MTHAAPPLPILFEDAEALVIDKPAGLASTPPRNGGHNLEDRLGELRLGFHREPAPVHRLDRDTSGCLLLARNPKALKRFAAAFEAGAVEKSYLGIVAGTPPAEHGLIDLPLAKISSREAGWRMVGDPSGKRAITAWRVLARRGGHSLIEFLPETGRTHQLRVHALEGLGAALVGDPVYGAAHPAGMMLHARTIRIARASKPVIAATAPLPNRFRALGFDDAAL